MPFIPQTTGKKIAVSRIIYNIMLFSMLHSTFVAPAQGIINAYMNKEEGRHYKDSSLGSLEDQQQLANNAQIPNKYNTAGNTVFNPKQAIYTNASIPTGADNEQQIITADIQEGIIGTTKDNLLDDPKDNIFKVVLDRIPQKNASVYLTYELYGVQDYYGVSRSINERLSTGGHIVKSQQGWTIQKEEINAEWLKMGENRIMFTVPKNANFQYRIKNLKIEIDLVNNASVAPALIVAKSIITYTKDNQLYVKGFLKNTAVKNATVFIENTELTVKDGEFEGFLPLNEDLKKRKFALVRASDNNGLLGQQILNFDNLIEADRLYPFEEYPEKASALIYAKKTGTLQTDGASIIVGDSALTEDKEITISRLRKVDFAPMTSGMINVTKGGYAYRFLPDGTKFVKPVAIAIGYDERLIPQGYSTKDIRTYYFNTNSKNWVAVKKDTLNETGKTVVSLTDHFTDYINGIIQAPESPETAGFTSTMMNDIKAADPSSEMTLISPPEVSQTGEAGISYPIKIPSGRRGIQPQVALQYSNEGGNGWVGQGWNVNTSAITIDTRWGVPVLDPLYESEIYTLGGEQLMYPKITNNEGKAVDWMPNRQYDASATTVSTVPIPRITDITKAFFTPRKQGSFAKIQRLGTSPDTYYWKVTGTDGSISWYGGKTAVVPNAVLTNANGKIVQWGLYMTEDVYGNNITYIYDNTTLPTTVQPAENANLSSGKIFNISTIHYTGFGGIDNGLYEINFKKSTVIRDDVSINARLGIKQVDPYFLTNIIVRRRGAPVDSIIRRYDLTIDYGRLKKGQLKKITEVDRNGKEFYSHKFDYYDDIPTDGQDAFFAPGVDVEICNDGYTPCIDSDGDGVCNDNDNCPTVAGLASNHGCPAAPVDNTCRSVTFPIPLTNIVYRYTLNSGFQKITPTCEYTPVRIKEFHYGSNLNVTAPNLYLTHYKNAAITNLCQANSTYTAIRNTDFNTATASWLAAQVFNGSNVTGITVYNNSQRYNQTTVNSFLVSLLSPTPDLTFGCTLEYRNMDSSANFVTFEGNSSPDPIQSEIYSGTGILSSVKVNGITLSSTQYDLESNLSPFIIAFKAKYGDQAIVTVENHIITIKIPNSTIAVNTITIGAQTYNFSDCGPKKKNEILTEKNKTQTVTDKKPALINFKTDKAKKVKDYTAYFNTLDENHQYTLHDGIPETGGCDTFINNDFLLTGNIPSFNSSLSLLGTSNTESSNAGFYLGVGIGCKFLTKNLTFGRQWNWTKDRSYAKTAMVDINGDGLDDLVIADNDHLYYKAHKLERTYENNEPKIVHTFGPMLPISGMDQFYKARGSAKSGNFQITFGIGRVGGFLGYDESESESTTNIYFTDSNGDGLIDIVKNGVAYFNRLDENNNPMFTNDSKLTENMVITAEPVTVVEPPQELEVAIPNYDVVKVWEAPADGNIKITNSIELTDDSKEAVATIEMKPGQSSEQCYAVSFPTPQINTVFYGNNFDGGTSFALIGTNTIDPSINGKCMNIHFRIKNVTLNGGIFNNTIFIPNQPNKLYMANGNEFVGELDQCPDYIPYNATSLNTDPVIKSLNSEDNIYNWWDTTVLQNIPHFGLNTLNDTGIYLYSSNTPNLNFGAECFTRAAFYSSYDLTGSHIKCEYKGFSSATPDWEESRGPDSHSRIIGNMPVGIDVNVYINGVLLSGGPFNLYDNPQAFKNALEAQYGSLYSFIGPTTSNLNQPISFKFYGSQPMTTIKLEPVSQPTQAITYNFTTSAQCGSLLRSGNKEETTNKIVANFNNITLSNEAQSLAFNKWQAAGNELLIPIYETPINFSFDFTNNAKNKSINGRYNCTITKDQTAWFNEKSEKITDKKVIAALGLLSPIDSKDTYQKVQEQRAKEETIHRKEAQLKAQSSLDEYFRKSELKSKSNAIFRSIDPTTCVDTTSPLCLLFGTKLDSNNVAVTNIITNASTACNASGSLLSVKKGDRIYFRVHSIDTGNPPVNWNPKVEYTNSTLTNTVDQDNIPLYKNSYSDGFILSKYQPVPFPGNIGTAKIEWPLLNVNNPSDIVTFEIHKLRLSYTPNGDESTGDQIIFTKTCLPGQNNSVSPTVSLASIAITGDQTTEVNMSGDQFYFKVTSTSNVNWKQFEWKPKLTCYVETILTGEDIENDETAGSEGVISNVETLYPVVDYSIYKSFPCSPAYALVNTNDIRTGPGNPFIRIHTEQGFESLFGPQDQGTIQFVVKNAGKVIARKTIRKVPGALYIDPTNSAMDLGLLTDPNIEIGFYADDSELPDGGISLLSRIAASPNSVVEIRYQNSPIYLVPNNQINLYQRPNPKFGPMLTQWGQFMYNPELVQGATPSVFGNLIKEDVLTFTESQAMAIKNAVTSLPASGENMTLAELQAFEQNYAGLLDKPLMVANAARTLSDGVYIERWTGAHDESYASALSYRAATLGQNADASYDGEAYDYQNVLETGAFAINKNSRGTNNNLSGGISVDFPLLKGGNASKTLSGNSTSTTDYIDFNGDKYPDIVTPDQVQLTNKTGGLFLPRTRSGNISESESSNWGLGAQASFSKGGQIGGDTSGDGGGFVRFSGFKGNSGGGLTSNFSKGKSITKTIWTDINGDGLADFLKKESDGVVTINLNYGYSGETTAYKWGLPAVFDSNALNISAGTGINKWNGSVELGLSLTSAWNNTQNTLVDMNGDGLLDYVSGSDKINVMLNQGNKFINFGQQWSSRDLKRESVSVGATINLTVSASLIFPFPTLPPFCIKAITFSPSKSLGSTTANSTKKMISDFDGDGYPDIIEQISNRQVRVYSSNIRRTGMLKTVTNPLNGSFTIDYKVQKVDYNNPTAKWLMSEISINDGYDKVNDGKDIYVKRFTYDNGKYDRRERQFYGYETVKTMDYVSDDQNVLAVTPYRTSVSKYYNNSYFMNGLLKESYVMKGEDETKKFSGTENFYEVRQLNETNSGMTVNVLPQNYDVGGAEGRHSAAVVLVKSKNYIYELSPTPQLTTQTNMWYDTFGRVINYEDLGNTATTADDYNTTMTYSTNTTLLDKNIINSPTTVGVYVAESLVKRRDGSLNLTNGSYMNVSLFDTATNYTTTNMAYDTYGNITKVTFALSENGQYRFYKYTYDTVFNKRIVKTEDHFGYSSTTTYDNLDLDKVIETVDLTGNRMQYGYDNFGRNTRITAPKEIGVKPYTLKFEYYPFFNNLPANSGVTTTTFVPVAVTKHYDQKNPTNDIEIYTFIDGMRRPIQVKKDIQLNNGTAQSPNYMESLSLSGRVTYDDFGRAITQYHPFSETKSDTSKFLLNEYASSDKSSTEYDEIDRPLKVIDPEGNISTLEYSVDSDNLGVLGLKTKSTVAQNSSLNVITETYKDVQGRIISTMNYNTDQVGNLWTQFSYKPTGELISYKDAGGMTTSYTYDWKGRKKTVLNPDSGLTTFTYDKTDNITSIQTANLAANTTLAVADRFIKYTYNFNLLTDVKYPDTPSGVNISNVHYDYGTTGNDKGRIVFQSDASGSQTFSYGNMGEMILNTRKIVGPNIPTRTFTTAFGYDSWNRLDYMVYPDGEKVAYGYDLGGNLNKISGDSNGVTTYIQRIDYDYFEQRTYLLYGNNTETTYKYTPKLRRLENLTAKTADHQNLFNNIYTYDNVGNVLKIANTAGYTTNNMGGSYEHNYVYDTMNRLWVAYGNFGGNLSQYSNTFDVQADYSVVMQYNETNGIVRKAQQHNKSSVPVAANTYDNAYGYYPNTHKLQSTSNVNSSTFESYTYDLNGNMTQKTYANMHTRDFLWDESNRLRIVSENISMQHYIYDAAGERVLKTNSEIESVYANGSLVTPSALTINSYTTYPSAFMVIDPNGIYSKHYYAGSQRIVSQVGDKSITMFESKQLKIAPSPTSEQVDDEKLRQLQITDLKQLLSQTSEATVSFKEYKVATYEETENEIREEVSEDNQQARAAAVVKPIYYYHPDHLGTSTFLTDAMGNAYQFFLNLPFGETMAEQMPASYYASPYKFNGKELDQETGLYYYGARYYDPKSSVWLSVDPEVEKTMAPYQYCIQNPINYIDPDGREEKPNSYEGKLGKGDWREDDRILGTSVWTSANKYNLQNKNGYNQYKTIEQRTDFYKWFQNETDSRGFETNWAGAAFVVAAQMSNIHGPFTALMDNDVENDVKQFAEDGNKAIFENVFGRLRNLNNGSILKGDKANAWDIETLTIEQRDIVAPIYARQRPAVLKELSIMSKGQGMYGPGVPTELKFNPKGNINNWKERFKHGMGVALPYWNKYYSKRK